MNFAEIPSDHLGLIGGVELDRRGRAPVASRARTMIVGAKTSAGTATANLAVYVGSVANAKALFGQGSQLALMVEAYLANDPRGEVWAIPVSDHGSGVAATGTIQVTAAATGSGSIYLYVAGVLVPVSVGAGDSANTIAAAINAALAEYPDLPVSASVSTDTVTLTARNDGVLGNDIDIRVNYRAGERLPAGVALTITAMSSGATDPTLTTANTALTSASWRHLVYPFTTDTQQDALDVVMAARWDALAGALGYAYSAVNDTVGNLTTYSADRNSAFASVLGIKSSPTPRFMIAAAYAGACVKSLRAHSAVPLANLALAGVLAPADSAQFTAAEIQTLGLDGIATTSVRADGTVQIANAVSTYKTDSGGAADATFRFVNSTYQTMVINDRLKAAIQTACAGKILVDDASEVSTGVPAFDPSMGEALADTVYLGLVREGVAEDLAGFQALRVVERNADNANRLDISFPVDLASPLHVVAVLLQPYVQFPGG